MMYKRFKFWVGPGSWENKNKKTQNALQFHISQYRKPSGRWIKCWLQLWIHKEYESGLEYRCNLPRSYRIHSIREVHTNPDGPARVERVIPRKRQIIILAAHINAERRTCDLCEHHARDRRYNWPRKKNMTPTLCIGINNRYACKNSSDSPASASWGERVRSRATYRGSVKTLTRNCEAGRRDLTICTPLRPTPVREPVSHKRTIRQ